MPDVRRAVSTAPVESKADGHDHRPITPRVNFDAVLRAEAGGKGRGHLKFRQPNDPPTIVYLYLRVHHLAPKTHYLLQRAVDTVVDDDCTSTSWLTLGEGSVPQDLVTDRRGNGRQQFFRALTVPVGTTFDIHFRVIDAVTSAVVLTSGCHQFVVS